VLWFLLLTSGVNKWADLSDTGSRALAGVELTASSGVGFLLFCGIFFSAVSIARRLSRNYTAKRREKREAAAAAEAAAASTGGGGGLGGARDSQLSRKLSSVGCTSKRGTLGGASSIDDGEIAAATATGGKPGEPSLPVISVLAGPPRDGPMAGGEPDAASPYADDTPTGR
jgi:hypothetical protein